MISASKTNDISKVRDECPVLIVGGGPSGLLQAYLLARLGVRSLIVEKYAQRLAAPKAHALSPRSLEICRQFSVSTKLIRSLGSPRKDAFWVNFVSSLDDVHIGRLPYERMDSAVLDMTPEMLHNIPQPDFEQIIANELSHNPGLVELRKNVSFVSLVQEDDHVTTVVQERDTGESYSIKSRFVVACDGHRSAVRDFLKIESEGESAFETMMTIHFHADLRSVVGSRVGILHWMMDPMVSGVLIAYDLGRNLVLLCNFDPEKQPVGTWTEDLCLKLVKAAIGPATPIQIQSWRPWALSRQVAKSYRTGNVFLAGDAAHSFPPTGGLGLNSGIADVHNLAYKLAAVLQGWADPSILSTYEFERRQVALVNSAQSLKNGKQILSLLKTLGTGTSNMTEARRNLHKVLCDKDQRVKIDRSISEQQEHFDNLGLHIGYVYGDSTMPCNASYYAPKYVPGARLPHAWIRIMNPAMVEGIVPADVSYVSELSETEIEERRWSTLDLCACDAMTIFLSKSPMSAQRVQKIKDLLSRDTNLCPISKNRTLIRFVVFGADVDVVPSSTSTSFLEGARLTEALDGGVLVNPDQHILSVISKETSAEEVVAEVKRYYFRDSPS